MFLRWIEGKEKDESSKLKAQGSKLKAQSQRMS
jgi:hypothetical protein